MTMKKCKYVLLNTTYALCICNSIWNDDFIISAWNFKNKYLVK